MRQYDHHAVERKWQERWEQSKDYIVTEDSSKPKYYLLVEFPYPSGEGLHVGHVRSYTALDIIARKRRAEGQNVLYPIGWDAFGLPTENYAVKTGIHPAEVTKRNTDNFRRQLKALGFSFDWSREINTTDPKYYKWTQWIFLQLCKKGLAYKARIPINWCPKCKIGLANEEVVDGACERCGFAPVEKREKEQWMLAITKYAQRLHDDLDTVSYIERAKVQQRNWIGPSEGARIKFSILNSQFSIEVFTTRPDTLFGATYLVLSPEHALAKQLAEVAENKDEVLRYIEVSGKKTEVERTAEGREKTGVELKDVRAVNPASGEEIPIFIADYVLAGYGTGAIMAVPAHDERDFAFAKKFNIGIKRVIEGPDASAEPYTGEGTLVNSGDFSGLSSGEAKKKITEFVKGEWTTIFKLRDWIFSRQRYWGEPIPMVFCEKCALNDPLGQGWVPLPEEELPLTLPAVAAYQPTETGESPLAHITDWVNTTCPACKGPARRETDTMPNWAGSSWYYLRYCDPNNDTTLASPEKLKYWTPVDWYNGGMEHTTLHLLYSRFWHKFLYDIGAVPTTEPYAKRTSHGLILAENGEKMSKSKGNVVSPDSVADKVGADTLRVYEMFTGPFEQSFAWSTDNMVGSRRFLERLWRLIERVADEAPSPALDALLQRTIKKVGEDIETLKMNTAVSQLMVFLNELEAGEKVPANAYDTLLKLISPFAPHITEELWEMRGKQGSVHKAPWPAYDAEKLKAERCMIAVQINGKVRAQLEVDRSAAEEDVRERALELPEIARWLSGGEVSRVIYVPERLINIVLRSS